MISKFISWMSSILASGIDSLTPLFILAAMIGVLITMAGARKLGTKISSVSFISYLILRMVL